ncbi:MAG: S8 family serine peptidase [Deltaproteobacteria bacterium]|nr:S8 family serine peptidase [Deltaproteobacteria bacterium]
MPFSRRFLQDYGDDICVAEQVLKVDPRLAKFLHPYRQTRAEDYHGTHVAGLMTYDRDDIGLISYRLLPYYKTKEDVKKEETGEADRFAENLADAIKDAHEKGVRIVNISLGGSFTKPNESDGVDYEKELETYNNARRMLTERITGVVNQYPDILFVAAAGNDGGWSDNVSRVQYPCGIEASNVLCVGGINEDDSLANFTNIPLNHVDLVFAGGVEIISTVPTDRCAVLEDILHSIFLDENSAKPKALCHYDNSSHQWLQDNAQIALKLPLIKSLYETCNIEENHYRALSGTSMATPLVAHLAAEILLEQPHLNGVEIIKAIKDRANPVQMGSFVAYKLHIKKPSWYQKFAEIRLESATHNGDYFDFYVSAPEKK